MLKNLLLWLVIAIVLITVFSNFSPQRGDVQQYSYSQFLSAVDKGEVDRVDIQDQTIEGVTKNNQRFTTYLPIQDPYLLGTLMKQGVTIRGVPPKQQSLLMHFLLSWGPFLLLIGVWIFFMRQMQGGGSKGGLSLSDEVRRGYWERTRLKSPLTMSPVLKRRKMKS